MSSKTKRIVSNSISLYIRMVFLLGVTLFTSRVLLDELGFEDFGIFNIVGGVAAMFVFFNSSLINATQRFLNIELGKGDLLAANVVFNQHLFMYLLVAIIIVVFSETLGVWFVRNELVLPIERVEAAVWVFRFTMLSLALTLIGVAFDSEIIAHEDMKIYSYVGVFEGVAKLVIVYLISSSPYDRLILYGFLLFVVTIFIQGFYICYSLKKYSECSVRFVFDRKVIKDSVALVGWNFVGTAVYAINDSGVNILLNIFFGPLVNAARAISYQINAAVSNFGMNFFVSIRPQIVKSYAVRDYDYLMKLFYASSKYSFYLLWLLSLPIMLNVDYILKIWQGEVPEYTSIFTILILLYSLINILNNPIWSVALAVGKLKKYICLGSGVFFLVFPISYLFLKLGYEPYLVLLVMCVVRALYICVVLAIIKEYIPFSFRRYFKDCVFPIFSVVSLSLFLSYIFYEKVYDIQWLFIVILSQMFFVLLSIFAIGINKKERSFMFSLVKKKIAKGNS